MAGNYRSHLGDEKIPPQFKIPQPFFKSPSCLIANGEPIVLPKDCEVVHYEAEMVIVIGKTCRKSRKRRRSSMFSASLPATMSANGSGRTTPNAKMSSGGGQKGPIPSARWARTS